MQNSLQELLQKTRGNLHTLLKSRPLFLPMVAAFIILLASLALASGGVPEAEQTLWEVRVNGQVVGWAQEQEEAEEIVDGLRQKKAAELNKDIVILCQIDIEEVVVEDREATNREQLAARLENTLSYGLPAAMMTVEGEPVVTISDRRSAESVLEEIREEYMPTDDNRIEPAELTILENVKIKDCVEEPDKIKSVEEAVKILLLGTDEIISHAVEAGESLWSIANSFNLTVDDLRSANPELESDTLQPGQELSLLVPKPHLTVETREKVVEEISIPFPTSTIKDTSRYSWERTVRQSGQAGKKEVVWEVVRQNGREIERIQLEETILQEPVKQIVAEGTKMPGAQGTGQFAWPMSRGSITSRYGSRGGRMHTGVDIAAPVGTPIYAADAGVVSSAGWNGGYGRTVIIQHGNGYSTLYAHCSELLVSTGTRVSKGQTIAKVGSTGYSTGPHLHFEIRVGGRPQNPMNYY